MDLCVQRVAIPFPTIFKSSYMIVPNHPLVLALTQSDTSPRSSACSSLIPLQSPIEPIFVLLPPPISHPRRQSQRPSHNGKRTKVSTFVEEHGVSVLNGLSVQ